MDFKPWPKIPRHNREVLITEKIDGSNGQIRFTEILEGVNEEEADGCIRGVVLHPHDRGHTVMHVGSRKRWIHPGKQTDNFGFAGWAAERAQELYDLLGPGGHYGEWYGKGIQRGYGLDERRFALFNSVAYKDAPRPDGVDVVPILYYGPLSSPTDATSGDPNWWADVLRQQGSFLVPYFMRPEGVIWYHKAGGFSTKVLLEGDDVPKGNG